MRSSKNVACLNDELFPPPNDVNEFSAVIFVARDSDRLIFCLRNITNTYILDASFNKNNFRNLGRVNAKTKLIKTSRVPIVLPIYNSVEIKFYSASIQNVTQNGKFSKNISHSYATNIHFISRSRLRRTYARSKGKKAECFVIFSFF